MLGDSPISLRPAAPRDREFLFGVYASSREEELAVLVDWTDADKEAFLRQQFEAQATHYEKYYPDASFDIVLLGDTPVGRLYVDRRETEIIVIDIALLTKYRRRGIGRELLGPILDEATTRTLPVRLHVETNNPIRPWYERLGFRELEQRGVYLYMERVPDGSREAT